MLDAYQKEDMEAMAVLYSNLDSSLIQDGPTKEVLGEIQAVMTESGYQTLADMGDREAAAGNQDAALDYYQKSLNIKGDNPQVIFNMAMIYKAKEETDTSNELFGQVIMNYPNTELAQKAKEERGY